MPYPKRIYHFGKSCYIGDFRPDGHISFGIAESFDCKNLTDGQRDNEMRRTSTPCAQTTSVLASDTEFAKAQTISNLHSIRINFGIRTSYFIKCFSLGYSEDMYSEVNGDLCVEIVDVNVFFQRFEAALNSQLPKWCALSAPAQYWDFSRVPVGVQQGDLLFLKDAAKYSSQKEYRIVLIPPEGFVVTDPTMRQSIYLGSLEDITTEKRRRQLNGY